MGWSSTGVDDWHVFGARDSCRLWLYAAIAKDKLGEVILIVPAYNSDRLTTAGVCLPVQGKMFRRARIN